MTTKPYLLDTGVLLALVRGKELGKSIDARFGLLRSKIRPLVCVVTHGEIRVLAARNRWGGERLRALGRTLEEVVTVDIHGVVIDSYVELDLASQRHPEGARNMGKNDVWIAAAAKACGATLLTTDQDFDHLVPEHLDWAWCDPRSGS